MKVLVVDEDLKAAQAISNVVNMMASKLDIKCEVLMSTRPLEALDEIMQDREIALVVTDYRMRQMAGVELADKAQRLGVLVKVLSDAVPLSRHAETVTFSRSRLVALLPAWLLEATYTARPMHPA